jgi:DNA-binding NtrC family response regulator
MLVATPSWNTKALGRQLRLLPRLDVAAILLDSDFPRDDLKMFFAVKESGGSIPVIVLSEPNPFFTQLGAVAAFVKKPFDVDFLLGLLAKSLPPAPVP